MSVKGCRGPGKNKPSVTDHRLCFQSLRTTAATYIILCQEVTFRMLADQVHRSIAMPGNRISYFRPKLLRPLPLDHGYDL